MSFPENRQQTFPAVPPPLSAGDHEMRDYYADRNAPRPTPNQTPYLTPYLGLRARLSQIWINRWTVLLLLILVRVLLAVSSTDNSLASARREALSACTSVEKVGSAMASMPHYMSRGVNKMTASGISKAVNGLETIATLIITGVEELIVFWIGMMTNTYLCLTTFAVTGSIRAVIDVLKSAQDELNKMTKAVGDELGSAANTVQNSLNSLTSGINAFTGSTMPKVDFTKQIKELESLKLPVDLTKDFEKLNSSLPTFSEVKNATESVIRFPFEELKKVIKESMGTYTFNDTLFPVAEKDTLTFCSDNNGINDFFDDLVKVENVARKVFLGTLITAAILVCIPMAWLEIQRYRRLQDRARLVGARATDPMDAVYMVSRPYTSRIGQTLSRKFRSSRTQILVRWAVAYPTSVPALFILSLGLAGLFACLCQYLLLKAIEKEVPGLTDQVANFTGEIVKSLNNASTSWADGTNQVILSQNDKFNKDLFGWVNTSTKAVNDTLNTFVNETMQILNATFGGTPLYDPVKEVFNCLVGLKVQGVQDGLTWLHDHAHVNFPLMDKDTLSLAAFAEKSDSTSDDAFLVDPAGGARDEISGAVFKVTNAIAKGIRQEAIISTMILVVWLIIALIGITTAVIRLNGRDRVRAEAGNEYNAPTHDDIQSIPRPSSAAPPYAANSDVNPYAPYTLNPHPFPRQGDGGEVGSQKRESGSNAWPFERHLTGQQPRQESPSNYPNEKNTYL